MEEAEEKRKNLLENLEKVYKKIKRWEKYLGSGFKRKLQKLFFSPKIYIPYVLLNLIKPKGIEATLFNKRKITLNINDTDSCLLYLFGWLYNTLEYKLTKFFIKNLKEKDIFYDIGANYGFYTYLALEFCKEVHSFEPIPYVFECLKKNLKEISRAHLNNIALSDKNEKLFLYILEGTTEGSTLLPEFAATFWKKSQKIQVKSITLNEYLKNHSKPTIIKLDVEGAESKIIDGGIDFLKNNSPLISMEVCNNKNEKGKVSMRAVEKLRNLGYCSYYINLNGNLEKIDGDLSEKVRENNLTHDNFIFAKQE